MKIKELRENYGYTQQQLADILDVSIHTIRGWEQGRRGIGRRSRKDIESLWPTDNEVKQLFSEEQI